MTKRQKIMIIGAVLQLLVTALFLYVAILFFIDGENIEGILMLILTEVYNCRISLGKIKDRI